MSNKEISTEYSLNTPNFFNENNILNKKILDMAKNSKNNMVGGGFGLDLITIITLLISIVMIIIGFVLLWNKNDLMELEAIIVNKDCANSDNDCRINIKYTVENTQYSKILTISKSNNLINTESSTIKIYYSKSEPNSITLYNPNDSMIGIGLIVIGIVIIIFSTYNSNNEKDLFKNKSQMTDIKTDLYSDISNTNGLDIVYSK